MEGSNLVLSFALSCLLIIVGTSRRLPSAKKVV